MTGVDSVLHIKRPLSADDFLNPKTPKPQNPIKLVYYIVNRIKNIVSSLGKSYLQLKSIKETTLYGAYHSILGITFSSNCGMMLPASL